MKIRSVSRAEVLLLWRNRTALFNALGLPLVLVPVVATAQPEEGALSGNVFLVTSLLGFVLLAAVYYNLVTTFVARREDLVLKRLRVGELTDPEILAATTSPSVVIALAQIVLFVAAGAVFLGLPIPVNAPVLVLGILGGLGLFALLAAVSSAFTRTVEMAQITALPILAACLIGSGLMVPLSMMPDTLATVLRLLPMTPVMELMRLGWLGTAGEAAPKDFAGVLGAAVVPTAILAAWVVFGTVAVRRWFRWEPRR